jgi:addiction module HigA family antidote
VAVFAVGLALPAQAGRGQRVDEILLEEYLKPLGLGQLEAAKRLGISLNRLNEIVLGKRGITADTALRLARFLKTSPQLWMRLQADWDLHEAMQRQARRAS